MEKKWNGILRAFYYGVTYLFLISFLPPVFLVMIYEALYIKVLKKYTYIYAFTKLFWLSLWFSFPSSPAELACGLTSKESGH